MFSTIFLQGLEEKTSSRTSKTLVNQPTFHLSLIFFLGFFHIGLLYLGFPSPLALLFVPLLYLACKANKNLNTSNNIIKHYVPFIILSLINISCHTTSLFESAEFIRSFNIFKMIFTLSVGIFYLVLIFSFDRSSPIPKSDKKGFLYHQLIGQLAILTSFMMCMGGMKLIVLVIGESNFDIIIKMLWVPLFISSRLLIALTWYRAEIQFSDLQLETEIVAYDEKLDRTKVHLLQYLELSEIYLDHNLTPPALAEKIGMSERELSKLLNQYLGQNFYHLIAQYRIAYAVKLIEGNTDKYTIDAMAGHCGYNSKTSFNKYFKEFIGCNPSEFRAKLANK